MARIWAAIRSNRGFLAPLLVFGLIRTAVADYNPVPSGSMHPSILEGDVVLVNRLAYQLKLPLTDIVLARLAEPRRGDIVTFSSPQDGTRLIKRVIGLPGDVIAMRAKRLFLNGHQVTYSVDGPVSETDAQGVARAGTLMRENLGENPYDVQWLRSIDNRPDFGPIRIPPDRYLMLGDNRDNSADSRYIGLVARERLIGRANRILVSVDMTGDWMPRFARFGKSLYE